MDRIDAIAQRPLTHPVCSVCDARMWFKRSESEHYGRERQFFQCARCKYEMSEVVDSRPAA
jgi:tRNA(Ile2) C34 agmatinyltransferase TiaS